MHYLFIVEPLKKKGQEEGVGLSSIPVEKKQKVQMPIDLEDEEDVEPVEPK